MLKACDLNAVLDGEKYPDSFFELLDKIILLGVKRRLVIELLDTILEQRFKVRDLSTRRTRNSVMRKSRVTVGGKRRGGEGREPDLGGGLVGGRQGVEGLFVGAQGVGAAGDVEGGVMQVLHGGGVVVLLHFLGDELGGEEDVVEIHEQIVVLAVEDADGGAQAIHSGSGHGHDKQHKK